MHCSCRTARPNACAHTCGRRLADAQHQRADQVRVLQRDAHFVERPRRPPHLRGSGHERRARVAHGARCCVHTSHGCACLHHGTRVHTRRPTLVHRSSSSSALTVPWLQNTIWAALPSSRLVSTITSSSCGAWAARRWAKVAPRASALACCLHQSTRTGCSPRSSSRVGAAFSLRGRGMRGTRAGEGAHASAWLLERLRCHNSRLLAHQGAKEAAVAHQLRATAAASEPRMVVLMVWMMLRASTTPTPPARAAGRSRRRAWREARPCSASVAAAGGMDGGGRARRAGALHDVAWPSSSCCVLVCTAQLCPPLLYLCLRQHSSVAVATRVRAPTRRPGTDWATLRHTHALMRLMGLLSRLY